MGVGLPLKNIPVQLINDSPPKPISDKQVKKEIEMVLEYNNVTFQLCRCRMLSLYALYAKSVLVNQNWLENIKNLFMLNTNLCVMIQNVYAYSRLNVAKRDTEKTSTKLKTMKMEMLLLNKKKIRQMSRNN